MLSNLNILRISRGLNREKLWAALLVFWTNAKSVFLDSAAHHFLSCVICWMRFVALRRSEHWSDLFFR